MLKFRRQGQSGLPASRVSLGQKQREEVVSPKKFPGSEKKATGSGKDEPSQRDLRAVGRLLLRPAFLPLLEPFSSGKEAKLFQTKSIDSRRELTVKVFKTKAWGFKQRSKAVESDQRSEDQRKSRAHRSFDTWAMKEYRNLKRMQKAGLRVPSPIAVLENVLIMEFIGRDGVSSPSLLTTAHSPERWTQLYIELVKIVRKMFQKAKLVHTDLSPFNILLNDNELFLVDVSLAIETSHPRAAFFLKRDLANVTSFFSKHGVSCFPLNLLFKFVTDKELSHQELDYALEFLAGETKSKKIEDIEAEDKSFLALDSDSFPQDLDFDQIMRLIEDQANSSSSTCPGISGSGLKSLLIEHLKADFVDIDFLIQLKSLPDNSSASSPIQSLTEDCEPEDSEAAQSLSFSGEQSEEEKEFEDSEAEEDPQVDLSSLISALSQTGYLRKEDIDKLSISATSKRALHAISREPKREKEAAKKQSESKLETDSIDQEAEEVSMVMEEVLNKRVETIAEKAARKKKVKEMNKQRKKNRYAA